MKPITAYHFLALGGRMRHPVNGHTHVVAGLALHEDEIQLCVRGLHASIKPIDALQYAPGPCLTLVECSGKIVKDIDKIVCTDRKVIAGPVDVTDIIVRFAQWCATRAKAAAAAYAANAAYAVGTVADANADAADAAAYAANAAAYAANADAAAYAAAVRADAYAANAAAYDAARAAAAYAAAYAAAAAADADAAAARAAAYATRAVADAAAAARAAAAAYDATAKVRPRQVRAPKSSTDERKAQNSWLRVEFAKALKAGG